jgi:hypothetical protein
MVSIKSINDLMGFITSTKLLEQKHSHLRIWFRGHSDKAWQLNPGVYRKSFIAIDEKDRLNKEQHLSQDFTVLSAGIRAGMEKNSELYFLQQHYGMPTRLLDWSSQPLAALFFAVHGNDDKDGEIFILDAYEFGNTQKMISKSKDRYYGIATGRNPLFKEAIEPIFDWKEVKDFPNFILPVRPDYFDKRMRLQKSAFTFHPPKNEILEIKHNKSLKSILIPKDAKPNLKKELQLLGIDPFNIFGDFEGLAKTLRNNYDV